MKTKKILLYFLPALFFFIVIQGVFFAESATAAFMKTSEVEWTHTYEKGEACFVEQTKDGGYVLTGWVECPQENTDVFLAKYDRSGNRLWLKTYRGYGYSNGHCVKEVDGGGFIVAGETKSEYGFDHDVYVVMTDEKGNPVWEKNFGGERCDYTWSVQQTEDGCFILAGGTESFGAGIYDVYLIKIDSAGNKIWEKTHGGADSDCGYAIQRLDGGGYLIAGNTESFGTANTDVYLLKTDDDGNMIWQKTYGGEGSDYGWALLKAGDGGYLIAGEKEIAGERGAGFAAYLIKVDPDGNKLWEKTYGNNSVSSFYAAGQVKDGGYILTGKIESAGDGYDLYVVKTNINGDPVWEKTFESAGCNCGYSVLQSKDGGYVIAGRIGIEKSSLSEVFLLKLKPDSKSNSPLLYLSGMAAVVLFGVLLFSQKRSSKK